MKTESIMYDTFILILTNTLVKLMSLIYRSITIRLIGAEGLGLTEMMMPFYSLLIVIASLGIPPAMSNCISSADSKADIGSVLKTATILLCISSTVLTALTCVLVPLFGEFIFPDKRMIPGFYVLIPSVFLISLFSVLRGYFQGTHQTSFIGRSQAVEQFIRIATGIALLSFLVRYHAALPLLIIGVATASLLGETGGGIYLWKKYRKQRVKTAPRFNRSAAIKMLRSGMPITMSRLILSVTTTLQATIVPNAMAQMGASPGEAAAFFGLFSGVALTVLHLPSVITGALITPLIPAIADSDHRNHASRNRRISKSILFTNITALPILALLFYFAKEICAILFASPEAGPMLSMLCLGGIFLYLQQPIVGILQGMNRFSRIFIHYCIADLLYIAALWYLQHYSLFTTERFLFLFIINDVILFFLNYFYLKKITGFRINVWKAYFAPIIALAAGFTLMIFSYQQLTGTPLTEFMSMILSALLFLLCYSFTLYLSGVIDKKTISSFLSLHKHH